jgi:peroxiredoxin
MTTSSQQRLQDLESRFMNMESKLQDTPEKQAISILHAMLQESLRSSPDGKSGASDGHRPGATLDDIANMYKKAPPMEGDAENAGIPEGGRAPDFTLLDASGKSVRLSDFRRKNVVLVFYPLDWSPACSDQLSLYQSEIEEFERANAQLLAISVDSLYSHGAWAAVRGLTFPLLSDFHPKGEVARRYGVMRDTDGFSERALYLIDPEGNIRYKYISPKLDHIPDIYSLLDQLNQLESQTARAGVK